MIKTVGPPEMTDAGRAVLAFHLHRYLAHWLAKANIDRVFVTVGWEHADVVPVTIDVGRQSSSDVDVAWTFAKLNAAYRQTSARLVLDTPRGQLEALPIVEASVTGDPLLLAFALVEHREFDPTLLVELEVHVGEAIRAARRNSVRLLFDESDERDMKALLYAVLDHLPQWVGCDVAAACVLANSLDAMAVDQAANADFYVMAERLFCSSDAESTRLVGLAIDTRDAVRTVIDAAIEGLADDPQRGVFAFVARDTGYVDDRGVAAVSIGSIEGRAADARSLVVPITSDHHGERELIGFLCLAYSRDREMPASATELLPSLGAELGHVLRTSPLYSLSAARLRVVRKGRRACESRISGNAPTDARRDALVADVVELIRTATGVPAFSVGYVVDEPRRLRYTSSYGWTDFDEIELLVDVAEDAYADSGISALAVRLNRPIILAGGRRDGEHQEFKNFLWVHEASGSIVDTRAPGNAVQDQPGWTRLGAYYKPARTGAYATIAHPIAFDGRVLGVVALEVDRDTDWTWWAGYGAQLFWELIASELAFALWTFDRELHG